MTVSQAILQKIERGQTIAASITAESDLYHDLGYDSLSFVWLLLDIETELSISFALTEMSDCVKVGQLIAMAEQKAGAR